MVAPLIAMPDITPEPTIPSEPSTTSASDPLAAKPAIITTNSSMSQTTRRTARGTRPANTLLNAFASVDCAFALLIIGGMHRFHVVIRGRGERHHPIVSKFG